VDAKTLAVKICDLGLAREVRGDYLIGITKVKGWDNK